MLPQHVEHVILVLHEDRNPSLGRALGQTDRALEAASGQIENMLLLALLLEHGQRERERRNVRYMAHISRMGVLLLLSLIHI